MFIMAAVYESSLLGLCFVWMFPIYIYMTALPAFALYQLLKVTTLQEIGSFDLHTSCLYAYISSFMLVVYDYR